MIDVRATSGRFVLVSVVVLLAGCGEVKAISPDAADDDAAAPLDAAPLDDGGDEAACAGGGVCLGAVPEGWSGPVAVGAEDDCPSAYPEVEAIVHRGLDAPDASCDCGCVTSSVDCRLIASNEQGGGQFEPNGSCDSPPIDNACLSVEAVASCEANESINVPGAQWDETASLCGGAPAGDACDGGSCYPAAGGEGTLCIARDGDHACPGAAGYTERTLYHRGFEDTRDCTACGCQATGQECEMDLEICSVSVYDVTLSSSGGEECLNSSDGDGVTLQSQRVTNSGSCTTSGGAATGQGTPSEPVTICCAP